MKKPSLKDEEEHVQSIVKEVLQFVKSDVGKKRGVKKDIEDIIKRIIPK